MKLHKLYGAFKKVIEHPRMFNHNKLLLILQTLIFSLKCTRNKIDQIQDNCVNAVDMILATKSNKGQPIKFWKDNELIIL